MVKRALVKPHILALSSQKLWISLLAILPLIGIIEKNKEKTEKENSKF